jgi:hypothetical protein
MDQVSFANPKLREIPIDVRLRPKKNLLIGVLLVFATICVAALGILITSLLLAAKISCLVLLAAAGSIAAVVRVGRLARRHFVNPQSVLVKDSRDPVLYLRSFYDDYDEISKYQNKKTPEENLASVLRELGPVIAVGKPGDSELPFLGATRVYLKDANWKPHVERLMEISKLVVIHPDLSLGVLWELEAVKRLVQPDKLLISFLHWQAFGLNSESYKRFSDTFQQLFGHALPLGRHNTTFVYFESDWSPRSIELIPMPPLFNPWIPFIPSLTYSPYIRVSAIREKLMPVFSKRGMIEF